MAGEKKSKKAAEWHGSDSHGQHLGSLALCSMWLEAIATNKNYDASGIERNR